MRGAGSSPIPYVTAEDRNLEEKEQTIVWIRPKNTKMGAYSSRRYTQAIDLDGGGDYREDDFAEAIVDDALAVIARIDNYAPSDDFLRSHPELRGDVNEEGFCTNPIQDADTLRAVVLDWMDGAASEVINASSSKVRLDDGAKKNLSWSPSLESGGPLPPRDGNSSTVTTASQQKTSSTSEDSASPSPGKGGKQGKKSS